ncbi:Uma2 family endonuclease [Leptolyngbya cf. ectocarpi LEGE 11479]|uniref:Uma2 family endonuclease n=1 Tax=Leptolyngbya cf. ectocarpi LEGE 11479 TaxID=1828722 RepID=A0A928X1E8_LEPEC|nr:Uma2 family endonuclease [Leptolyngbya ectocarpi]MBE9066677.1 Uma2 family endonuclease [Leptolyngbya cf. ectocarpi LEGE 11479]
MVQNIPKALTFEEFTAQYGDDTRYELIDGELVEMEPTRPHEQVTGFVNLQLNLAIAQLKQPYFIPMRCLIKPLGPVSAFKPDVVVLDRPALEAESLWQREPIITLGTSAKLVVEVVSTNWQNDYARKYDDYQAMGIPEYWIVDYLGLGGTYFIGSPKQPTVTICNLKNNHYEMNQFRQGETLVSCVFPEISLQAEQIFAAGS